MKDIIHTECAFFTDNPDLFSFTDGQMFKFIHGHDSKSPFVEYQGINKAVSHSMTETLLFPENMTYLGYASVLTIDNQLEFEY